MHGPDPRVARPCQVETRPQLQQVRGCLRRGEGHCDRRRAGTVVRREQRTLRAGVGEWRGGLGQRVQRAESEEEGWGKE